MTTTLDAFIEKDNSTGLPQFLLQNYADVDDSKIEILEDDYYTTVDHDMADRCRDIKNAVFLCIKKGSIVCLEILCRHYPFLDFPIIAIQTLIKGDTTMYTLLLNFTTEIKVAKAHIYFNQFSHKDLVKSLEMLLSMSPNSKEISNTLYQCVNLACASFVEDLHTVLVKYADAEKHHVFEERVLELLKFGSPEQIRPVYRFITLHPKYTWKDKKGNCLLHYLAVSKLHYEYMRKILSAN